MNLKEEEYWDLLEDYASQKLNADTQQKVARWLKKNEDARTTLLGIEDMMAEIPQQEDRNDFFRNLNDEMISAHLPKEKNKIRYTRWYWMAASLIVMVGISYFLVKERNDLSNKVNTYLSQHHGLSNQVRSDSFEAKEKWPDAYHNAQYEKVITILANNDSLVAIEKLYLGLSYMYTDQYNLSINQLNIPFANIYLDPQRQWYLSLAYIKSGQNNLAIQTLKLLIEEQSFMNKEAEELLDLLQE